MPKAWVASDAHPTANVHYQDEAIRVLVELLQLIHIEDTKPELDLS